MKRLVSRLKQDVTFETVLNSFLLTLKLGLFGFCIWPVPYIVLWLPIQRQPILNAIWEHDTSNNHTFIYFHEKLQFSQATRIGGLLIWQLPFNVFLPLVFALYLRLSFISAVKLIAFVLLGMIPFLIVTILFRDHSSIFIQMLSLCPFILFLCYLKFFIKVSYEIIKTAALHIGILLLGIMFVTATSKYPSGADSSQVALILLVFPTFREASMILSRNTGFCLLVYATQNETEKKSLKRPLFAEMSTLLVIWTHGTWSLFLRLNMSEIHSYYLQMFVVGCFSVLEIVLRLTLYQRMKLNNWIYRILCRPQSKKVDPEKTTNEAALSSLRHEFTSMIILSEIVNEYIAIFLVPILLHSYYGMKLGVPFGYYNSYPNIFSAKGFNFRKVAIAFLIQLVAEVFVDTICCLLEGIFNKGVSIDTILKRKAFGRNPWPLLFLLFGVSCCFGHVFAFLFVFLKNGYALCKDMNICCCAQGRGLQQGGLVQSYCDLTSGNYTDLFLTECGMSSGQAVAQAQYQYLPAGVNFIPNLP